MANRTLTPGVQHLWPADTVISHAILLRHNSSGDLVKMLTVNHVNRTVLGSRASALNRRLRCCYFSLLIN